MTQCLSPSFPTPFGFTPKVSSGGCGCGGGCSGGCDGFRAHNGREEPCCSSENEVEVVNVGYRSGQCPDGSIPQIVVTAKTHPFFAPLFGCFDDESLKEFMCCMGQYALPGCGDTSVLLAAAHFYTMITSGQKLVNMTMVNQAKKGKALEAVAAVATSMGDQRYWSMSMYGQQYQELRKPMKAYLGMAWGI